MVSCFSSPLGSPDNMAESSRQGCADDWRCPASLKKYCDAEKYPKSIWPKTCRKTCGICQDEEEKVTWQEVCTPGMEDFSKPGQHSDWCVIAALGSSDDTSWCNEVHYKGNCCASCYEAEKERLRRKATGEDKVSVWDRNN